MSNPLPTSISLPIYSTHFGLSVFDQLLVEGGIVLLLILTLLLILLSLSLKESYPLLTFSILELTLPFFFTNIAAFLHAFL